MRVASRLAPGYDWWGRIGLYEPLVGAALGRTGADLRRRAVDVLELRAGESVIDIATGTGLMLGSLVDGVGAGGRIVGIDRSSTMLARAVGRAPSPPVELVEGDAQALPFADGEFDAA